MEAITGLLNRSVVLYAVLAASDMLLITVVDLCAAALLFHFPPRGKKPLYALALLVTLTAGSLRPFAFAAGLAWVRAWNVAVTLAPFVCLLLIYPLRAFWKAALVCLGYELAAALKYLVLLLFAGYDNDNVNDPLELLVELAVNAAVLLLFVLLLLRSAGRRRQPLSVTPMGAALYLLIVATVVVFSVSVALMGPAVSREDRSRFLLTMLNVPLFAATVTCAALSISRSRQQERAYKERLSQQIKHYEMMEQLNEDLRDFRHDLPKILRPFTAYLDQNDDAEAREIAAGLSGFAAAHGKRFNTGNYRLDTVLFCQQQLAQQDGITINYTFGSVFPKEGIDPEDLYVIFPNALDNAIEACRKTGEPCEIVITSRIRRNEVLVTISNPVAEAVTVENGMPRTNKSDKKLHGNGFRSMKKAAAKYGEDNLDFRVENGRFLLRFNLTFREEDGA